MSEADKKVLIASRFAVLPINFLPEHWAVFILDKTEKTVFSFDSMETGRKGRGQTGLQLVKWMVERAGQSELTLNLHLHEVTVPQQLLPICGLIVLASVRLFFQCHYENQPHIVNGQTFHQDEAPCLDRESDARYHGARYMPHISQDVWMRSTILGMACGTYLCGLYNLDGQLRGNEYLDGQILLSGVRLAVGHHRPLKIPEVFNVKEAAIIVSASSR